MASLMIQSVQTHSSSVPSRALRAAMLLALMLAGTALGGCSKCGFIWDEGNRPASCRTAPEPASSTASLLGL